MASEYVTALRSVQTGGPLVLLGYCFGGMIAYEMARQLLSDRSRQLQLVLVDSHPPGADDGYLDSRDFIEAQLTSAPLTAPMESWIGEIETMTPASQAEAISRHIDWRGMDRATQSAIEQTLLDMLASNAAKNRYHPEGVVDVPVHLMRIDDEAFHRDRNSIPHLGWQRLFRREVSVRWLSGAHLDLFAPERIADIARGLDSILRCSAPTPIEDVA